MVQARQAESETRGLIGEGWGRRKDAKVTPEFMPTGGMLALGTVHLTVYEVRGQSLLLGVIQQSFTLMPGVTLTDMGCFVLSFGRSTPLGTGRNWGMYEGS